MSRETLSRNTRGLSTFVAITLDKMVRFQANSFCAMALLNITSLIKAEAKAAPVIHKVIMFSFSLMEVFCSTGPNPHFKMNNFFPLIIIFLFLILRVIFSVEDRTLDEKLSY